MPSPPDESDPERGDAGAFTPSSARSPLGLVMRDPIIHEFIAFLAEKRAEQEARPAAHLRIELSRRDVARVREAFKQNILDGERHLHVLAHALAQVLLEGEVELHSNVIGILPGGEDRPFLIRERISRDMLLSKTDLELGRQMLGNFRYLVGGQWRSLDLSANFVEYIPRGRPSSGVNRITSRVKAEEELWNKVTDELFNLDQLVTRDKHLRQYSKFVKDVFGIKIVCDDDAACLRVHERLGELTVGDCDWHAVGEALHAPDAEATGGGSPDERLLEFVETKDYLRCDPAERKKTGWRALKSVVRWRGHLLEIQVQPLGNYYLELDHMAGPSHRSFKTSRDALRREIARRLPLYGLYRDLLRMLFLDATVSFDYDNASVILVD